MPSERIEIPFNGQAYKSGNSFLSAEECVNYFVDIMQKAGGRRPVLRGAPGLKEWVDLGTSAPGKGLLVNRSSLYAVSGDLLFRIDAYGNVVQIDGDMSISEPIASMITNGLQVGIFGGDNGYVFKESDETLSKITAAGFPGGTTAAYQDGYAFVNRPDTAQFFKSGLNDFTSWDALDFSSAGWKSDNLLSVFSDHRDIWLGGHLSIEPWFNDGGVSDLGFSRRDGAEIEMGLAAAHSFARINNAVFWLGRDEHGQGQVFQALQFQPVIISTDPITEAINSYSDISDAIGFAYQFENHNFYELTFPSADVTWLFDSSNPSDPWSERRSYRMVGSKKVLGRHRVHTHAFFAGKHLMQDIENGKIYEMSRSYYDEDGEEMPAIRTAAVIDKNQDLLTINELQILFTPGVGLGSGQGSDPVAIVSLSPDGGFTFGNERQIALGKQGEYKNRAVDWQFGQGRNWVIRSKVTDPINRDIFGAFVMIEHDGA